MATLSAPLRMTAGEREKLVRGALAEIAALKARNTPALREVRRRLSARLRPAHPDDVKAVSLALKATGLAKVNHDVVVQRGRVPQLFDVVAELKDRYRLRIASFGHAGDGNIHVNIMMNPDSPDERERARLSEWMLFEGVLALEGSISGEHGIGFAKKPYIGL